MNAQPAIVIAHTRSGGCWLMHCLSSHPDISCPRGEPLLPASNYRRAFPKATDTDILTCVGNPEQYRIGIAKVTYNQLTPGIEKWIDDHKAPVIHLTRRNIVRVVVSQMITGMAVTNRVDHVAHSFKRPDPVCVHLSPNRVLHLCKRMVNRKVAMMKKLGKYQALHVDYAEMVGGEGNQAAEMDPVIGADICDHLGIQRKVMTAQLKRVNGYPLHRIIKNWAELQYAVKHSKFAWCLDDEGNFE